MPALPLTVSPQPQDLEPTARRFAALARDEAELAIDLQVGAAIRAWRIADATFWQRVRFRSRMIRSADRSRSPSTGEA